HIEENENNSPVLMNTLKLKKESCEVIVECLSDKSFDALTSIPGDFGVIMQMTTEMIIQATQNKVHIPMRILTQNDKAEDIYFITIPDSPNYNQQNGQGWQWRELLQYLKKKYNYLAFAIKPAREKVLMSPADDTNIPKGCSIWLLAEKRPVNINWKNAR
ncbi:MAG: potassium channel protein, partial [Desulfobacteraceae bacterium]|nr:potassium channel protein [Desulfobacteraceae bacterium]